MIDVCFRLCSKPTAKPCKIAVDITYPGHELLRKQKAFEYSVITGYLYSYQNLLVCGAQLASTHNTAGVRRTRNPRSVEGCRLKERLSLSLADTISMRCAAVHAGERVVREDTDHYVIGFVPFGDASQLSRSRGNPHNS